MASKANHGSRDLIEAAEVLRDETGALRFGDPVTHVYDPLDYAWEPHQAYLRRFGEGPRKVVFLGMNPGPFGMAQTGVPFGEVAAVRDWMGIESPVSKPDPEHPRRPVLGFACPRSEVSGRRLWGLFAERFHSPEAFFRNHFVVNYCPLVFMESTGRNRTPDKLAPGEQAALREACDRHLRRVLEILDPDWAIGVGAFATRCLERVGAGRARIATILHPSPASPAANRDWAGAASRQLVDLGVWDR